MVTMTRELEQSLIAAGVPEEQAREIVEGLEARLSEVVTKADLERELAVFRREMALRFEGTEHRFDAVDARFDAVDARFEAVNARFDAVDQRIDDLETNLNHRFDGLNNRLDDLNRTMWRVVAMLVTIGVAGGGALFGALMYAIFR